MFSSVPDCALPLTISLQREYTSVHMLYFRCYRSSHITNALADQLAQQVQRVGGWFTVNSGGLYLYIPEPSVFWFQLIDSDMDRVHSLDYVV